MNQVRQCSAMRFEDIRSLLRTDAERYLFEGNRQYSRRSVAIILVTQPGFLATALYRFGHWAYQQGGLKGRWCRLLRELAKRPVEILTGISISPTTHIGPGLYVAHFGGVFVGGDSVIGTNCNLGHDTLIAASGRGARRGSPRLGDRVNVTCGGRCPRARTRRRRRHDRGQRRGCHGRAGPHGARGAATDCAVASRGRSTTSPMQVTSPTRIGMNQQL